MKRKIFLLFSFVILLLLIFTIFNYKDKLSDVFKKSDSYSELNLVEGVRDSLGKLNITVDPRIELITAIQQQSDYLRLTQFDFNYKDEMKEYFSKYKNHKAVKLFRKLSESGFSYDAPPNVMLYLSSTLSLKEDNTIPDHLTDRAQGKKELLEFIDELKDFSLEANFNKFYEKNNSFYQTMIDNVYKDIKDMGLIETLDNYYGMEVNSYNLILAPMLHAGGYGPKVEAENGLYDVYGIIGPQSVIEGNDGNKIPNYSSQSIQYLVWHEFSHSFINPITEKYISEVNQYSELFSKIEKQMSSQAYGDWETCVNEHIIRAITARFIYLDQGESAYNSIITFERANGFYYVPSLCESLAHYEINRDDYPTFESYYPELIKVFKELSKQELDDEFFQIDFYGPINAAVTSKDSTNVVIITPTQEKDAEIQEDIYSYLNILKDNLFPKAEIVKDTDAINRDFGDYLILAYGTIEGNLWLQEYKDIFPFTVEEDKIIADETYEDSGMVMISAMPNPQNYKSPLVIYTAQDAKDIIGINNVFHGPTDFTIVKDGRELHSGFYDKNEGTWSFK